MTFKPYWGLTLFSLAACAVLVALGLWQLERLEWKRELIAAVDARIKAAPVALDEMLERYPDDGSRSYRPVRVEGRFDHGHEFHRFVPTETGAGYHILTPLLRERGPPVLVNRGLVMAARKDPSKRMEGQSTGVLTVTGVTIVPGDKPLFTPKNDVAKNLWYWIDLERMALVAGIGGFAPVVVNADQTEAPGPEGGQTRVSFRNDHLGYALTWFGLAAGLVAVYAAFHMKAGRLHFRSDRRD